jgi:predicted transcriptional regulator
MDIGTRTLAEDHRLFRVLYHLSIAKVDYAKNVMRYTEIPVIYVADYLEMLRQMGFLEYYTNTSIKRSDARLKKSAEVHKHHTYYAITRKGELALKNVTPKVYLELLDRTELEDLAVVNRKGSEVPSRLIDMGLVDRNRKLTVLGKNVIDAACRRGF